MNPAIGEVLTQIAKHADLVMLIIDAIENHKVDSAKLVKVIKQEMAEASDALMRKELGSK